MHIPTDKDVKLNPSDGAPPPNAYLPERCIHTWVSWMHTFSYVILTCDRKDWPQQSCFGRPLIPSQWSPSAFCQYGHEGQALGRLQ